MPDTLKRLGPYRLVREIGRGSMGTVYLALRESMGRELAIKVLGPEFSRDPEFLERFRREAVIGKHLKHPHIARVFEAGQDQGLYYIVMEYLGDTTLVGVLEQSGGTLPPAQVVSLADNLLDALSHAHSQGVVHRDLKPANVMLRAGGEACLTDFSIARMQSSGKLTRVGMWLGTPQYMAPEQFGGSQIDHRADIYSLGVMLYELLTGIDVFGGGSLGDILRAHMLKTPENPSLLKPGVSQSLGAVLLKALEKKAEDRYQSAQEMRQALLQADAPDPPTLQWGGSPKSKARAPAKAASPPPQANVRARSWVEGCSSPYQGRRWQARSGKILVELDHAPPPQLTLAEDGKLCLAGQADSLLKVNGQLLAEGQSQSLNDGDLLQVGLHMLRVRSLSETTLTYRAGTALCLDFRLEPPIDPSRWMPRASQIYQLACELVEGQAGQVLPSVGEPLMAVFQASNHASTAIHAARELVGKLAGLKFPLTWGTAVHSGPMAEGIPFQDPEDCLWMAARLGRFSLAQGAGVLLSAATRAMAGKRFATQPVTGGPVPCFALAPTGRPS